MPRRALTAAQVKALTAIGTRWCADGLYLQVKPNNARSWLYRYSVGGKSRWHGLGSERDVPLADARQKADELRVDIRRHGLDPVADRRAKRADAKASKDSKAPSFEIAAERYIDAHQAGWKNEKHRAQWSSTLQTYVYPKLGATAVDRVGVDDVIGVLKPIWSSKAETAGRVRGRIEAVLSWAKAMGYREGDNPASWKGALKHLLPALASVQKVETRRAMLYREVPVFAARLGALQTTGAKALHLLLLTATRTTETLGATWNEVSLDDKLWVIPADRMKAGKEHRIPLSDAAVSLLASLPGKRSGLVFPGARKGKTLSNATMQKVLRTLRPGALEDVHGFRSSFRDWAAEQTDYPREVAEASWPMRLVRPSSAPTAAPTSSTAGVR